MNKYIVLQMTLTDKIFSINPKAKNLPELERMINEQAERGYRLHTIIPVSRNDAGIKGDWKTQVVMVFEKI